MLCLPLNGSVPAAAGIGQSRPQALSQLFTPKCLYLVNPRALTSDLWLCTSAPTIQASQSSVFWCARHASLALKFSMPELKLAPDPAGLQQEGKVASLSIIWVQKGRLSPPCCGVRSLASKCDFPTHQPPAGGPAPGPDLDLDPVLRL